MDASSTEDFKGLKSSMRPFIEPLKQKLHQPFPHTTLLFYTTSLSLSLTNPWSHTDNVIDMWVIYMAHWVKCESCPNVSNCILDILLRILPDLIEYKNTAIL